MIVLGVASWEYCIRGRYLLEGGAPGPEERAASGLLGGSPTDSVRSCTDQRNTRSATAARSPTGHSQPRGHHPCSANTLNKCSS